MSVEGDFESGDLVELRDHIGRVVRLPAFVLPPVHREVSLEVCAANRSGVGWSTMVLQTASILLANPQRTLPTLWAGEDTTL